MVNKKFHPSKKSSFPGYALSQFIYDDQREVRDFVFLHANRVFSEQVGLVTNELEGKKASDLLAKTKNGDKAWLIGLLESLKNGNNEGLTGFENGPGKYLDINLLDKEKGIFEIYVRRNGQTIKEKETLENLLQLTEEFIKNSGDSLNYQKITDNIRELSGAKFVLLSLYNETKDKFKTVAVSGSSGELKKAERVIGSLVKGREWPSPPERVRRLKRGNLTVFSGLSEKLAGTPLEALARHLDKILGIGQVGAIEMAAPGKALANVMIVMDRDRGIKDYEIIELFVGHVELLMTKEKAEQALKQSEEKFRLLFNHAPIGLFHFNLNGEITACNEKFLEIFALDFGDEKRFNIYNPPSQMGDIKVPKIEKGKIKTFEGSYFSRRRNRDVSFRALLAPLLSPGDKIIGAMGIVEDISSRRSAEKALREREAKLQSILQTAPIGIGVDKDRKLQEANGHLVKITGYPLREMLGRNFGFLYATREEYERVGKEKQKQLEEKGKAHLETTWKTKSGELIDVLLNYSYLNPQDLSQGLTFTALDITRRKVYEERLNFLSFHDSLTGLNNRAYLEEKMKELDESNQLPISVVMADINGLKMINDAYGHKVGDRLLKRAAELMKNCCSPKDYLSRWGGDEFMFFLPKTPKEEAEELAVKLREACRGEKIEGVPLSISMGVSCKGKNDKDLEEVLKEAEDEMYQRKLAESRSVRSLVLSAILKTLGLKSDETEEHAVRMQKLALDLGERIKLPQAELDRLLLLVSLHDIGKISIGEDILRKPDKLNAEEWEIVKKHPEIGYRLAISTGEFAHIAEEILSHHEHWNGEGYPRGLNGQNIPLLARIIAIIDAFDVMTNGRPYKTPMTEAEALAELKRCAGTQFDPRLVRIFIDMFDKKRMEDS